MNENEKNIDEADKDSSKVKFNRKAGSRRSERALAFQILYASDRDDYSVPLDQVIQRFRYGFDIDIQDDSIVVKMVEGAIDMRDDLDEEINPLLKNWKINRLGCCTLLILRLALWELKQSDGIPSIVINEAVELAKCFAEKDSYKFINGILDEYCTKNKLEIVQKTS
ncbi:transcription antitermination factor NusB [Candidatus Dependentiae bacterium]